jgi:hypothetical protein
MFAHPNPKVAAYLASKNREALKQQEQDPFGDGLGKRSLLPNINQTVTNIKNRLDSALSNDEDSQKYLNALVHSVLFLVERNRYIFHCKAHH